MEYYVYENWRATDKVVIHKASCSYCNNGRGCHKNILGNENGMWWGPLNTFEEAAEKARTLRRREVRKCKICLL
ncbi:MAG: hypothetical protein J6O39_04445 [Treponema sp.]|nr:hypothetical protein [Treponema sp.]